VGRGRPGEEDKGSNAGRREGRRRGASAGSVDFMTWPRWKGEASILTVAVLDAKQYQAPRRVVAMRRDALKHLCQAVLEIQTERLLGRCD
jgi:hypothetical protein